MYKIKESGKGKLYCYTKGVFALNEDLKQSVLKQLYKDNCEHIYYEQSTTSEEAETSESTAKDSSNGSSRRKANKGKANKKRTDD